MAKLFLTGDRSFSPIYPGLIYLEVLRAVVRGDALSTGDNDGGVEQIVRELVASVDGLELEVVASPQTPEGKVDWDARHSALGADVQVKVFHVEPMSSSVVKSVLATLSEERVDLITPAELLG